MKEFLFIFRGGMPMDSPEVIQSHMLEWRDWMDGLAKQGKLFGGQPLESGGKTVTGSNKVFTDGPFIESKEMVGGYLLIKAADINEATELSKGCPILPTGGIVEVRPIQQQQM